MMRKVSRLSDWQPPTSLSAESPAVHSAGGSYRSGTVARAFTRRRSPEQQQDAGASQSLALSASTGASDSAINPWAPLFSVRDAGPDRYRRAWRRLFQLRRGSQQPVAESRQGDGRGLEANAHRWNSPGDAPATGSGLGPCAAGVLNEVAARAYFPHKPRENTEKQI